MGNRYNGEKPFALYDPEHDRERQRQAPRNWSAPPGAAQQFPPGPEPAYNRPGLSTPPREQALGRYNPELDRERPRQGMSNSYSSGPRSLDSVGMAQGAPPNGRGGVPEPGYAAGRGAGLYPPQPNPGSVGRGGRYGDPDYGEGGYPGARPEMPGRGAPLERGRGGGYGDPAYDGDARGHGARNEENGYPVARPEFASVSRRERGYEDPGYDAHGNKPAYRDAGSGYPMARPEIPGRGAPSGRGRGGGGYRDPAFDDDAHGEDGYPMARPEMLGRGAPLGRGRGGGGFRDPAFDGAAHGEDGYPGTRPEMLGRGAPSGRGRGGGGYRDPAFDDDTHGEGGYPGTRPEMLGRGAPLERGRGGGGFRDPAFDGAAHGEDGYPGTRPEFASGSGRGRGGYEDAGYGGNRNKPMYGDAESRAERMPSRGAPFGRGDSAVPMGDGYVYGGLRQLERLHLEEEYDAPPAPISSEYAHQVYASVFSDPVYGGAGQVNPRAGYLEQPDDLRQERRREDVLRHPDQY